jgi:radical SAM-linked protein
VATFVPKPHTPFQWEPQIPLDTAIQKINWLKENLKLPGVKVKWQDPRVSMIEGIWARGDRKLNQVLIEAWQSGCRFDGWTDFFNYERWQMVFSKAGIDPNHYTGGYADTQQSLPWDHINIGVDRSYLAAEKERATAGEITEDCRTGACSGCGVCDFNMLHPVSYHGKHVIFSGKVSAPEPEISDTSISYVVNFKKMNNARFLGHLEMVKIFTRGLRRANIPINYSHGFHPMPKVSFGDTLPMGMQSQDEQMRVSLSEPMDPEELVDSLHRQMPSGLEITGCRPDVKLETTKREPFLHYLVELNDGFFDQNDLDWFLRQQVVNIERKSKKGKAVIMDLKKAIGEIQLLDKRHARMILGKDNRLTVRPAQVMKVIFHLNEEQILSSIITKQKAPLLTG